ncbi:hypothetical protein BDW02DRAFT_597198 [Decorospora gaudefroyi]|uniref:BTB domain-containing protein n=1 Tax=Decorospora gaudefroyi TaxID=184978 RepID=A0A6A5KIX5_9PLEO|nr:hypothetical protein BDW02DRAFT_597198 [Decorospora gaudefroyi]
MNQTKEADRKTLYNSPTFSDIKIRQIHKGKVTEYAAHKAVLCAHSGWFMAALTGHFKHLRVRSMFTMTTLFQIMMEFFYNMDLKTPPYYGHGTDTYIEDSLVPLIDIHTLAGKYDVRSLQRASADVFKKAVQYYPTFTVDRLELLVHAHYPFCTSTCCDMGEAIVTFMLKNSSSLMQSPAVHSLVRQYGNFGGDMFVLGIPANKLSVKCTLLQ